MCFAGDAGDSVIRKVCHRNLPDWEETKVYHDMKGSSGSQLASSTLWGSCLFKAVYIYVYIYIRLCIYREICTELSMLTSLHNQIGR